MSLWLFLWRSMAGKRQCILRIEQAMQGHLFQESPTPHEGAQPGGADHSAQRMEKSKLPVVPASCQLVPWHSSRCVL